MNTPQYNVKECSYECCMIGCKYSCTNTSKEMKTNIKTLYKCYEYSCNDIFINKNDFDIHLKNHKIQIWKLFNIIGEKPNNELNFLPPPTFSNIEKN